MKLNYRNRKVSWLISMNRDLWTCEEKFDSYSTPFFFSGQNIQSTFTLRPKRAYYQKISNITKALKRVIWTLLNIYINKKGKPETKIEVAPEMYENVRYMKYIHISTNMLLIQLVQYLLLDEIASRKSLILSCLIYLPTYTYLK